MISDDDIAGLIDDEINAVRAEGDSLMTDKERTALQRERSRAKAALATILRTQHNLASILRTNAGRISPDSDVRSSIQINQSAALGAACLACAAGFLSFDGYVAIEKWVKTWKGGGK